MEILKGIKKEYQQESKRVTKDIKNIKSLQDDKLNNWWYKEKMTAKTYKLYQEKNITLQELKKAMIKKALKEIEKRQTEKIAKLQKVESHERIKHGVINIYTNYSRTWGYSPKGEYKNGFFYKEFGSVGGCGYDKNSTLSAAMLNNDFNFLKYLYEYIEKHNINKKNISKKLGYGIRLSYGLPYFEGGVGLECHINILKKLGFKVFTTYNKTSITVDFQNYKNK